MKFKIIAATLMMALAHPAFAKGVDIKPMPHDGQTVRYDKGIATIDDDLTDGAVRIKPILDYDHGSIQFFVAVYNKSASSFNFGVENISVQQGDNHLAVFTKDELEKKAKQRAAMTQLGLALLTGVAAGMQNNNTYINTYTPHGPITTVVHSPGLSDGQIVTLASGGAGIAASQIGLQRTLDSLNEEIVQTTTVDPNSGYGGRIVLAKMVHASNNEDVSLDVQTGSEHHIFEFTVSPR